MIAARAGQGFGAALAVPNALAILSRTFAERPQRNRALGIFGAAAGVAAIAGSILGGLLEQGPGWQWVFFINVPMGLLLAGFVLARVAIDAPRPKRARADIGGAVTLTAGLIAVTFGVHESIGSGWLSARTSELDAPRSTPELARRVGLTSGALTAPECAPRRRTGDRHLPRPRSPRPADRARGAPAGFGPTVTR